MKPKHLTILALSILALSLFGYKASKPIIRNDFKKYFDLYDADGSFVLYDQKNNEYTFYNREQSTQAFTPASTFKICNSLIGLETGVIKNENYVLPWDSIKRRFIWDTDTDLKTAYKNSTVWYYQELARRVEGQQMKYWLDKAHYGNADTSGGIDKFWLSGGLRISPQQQIDFLRRLHDNKLPFSQRSVDIVKKIMIQYDTLDYVIRAKTGWGDEPERFIGWYVGYVEKGDNVYYFSTCMQTRGKDDRYIAAARKAITFDILDDLGIVMK